MPLSIFTARDHEILSALDRCPLTAAQFLKLSQTFSRPFGAERLVRRRLTKLEQSGLVRRATYTALAGRGTPNYYLLTPLGHRMLHGPDSPPPAKRFGQPLGPASHRHAWSLSELIVHLSVAAHRLGVQVGGFCRENSVALTDGEHTIYPDCAFQLHLTGRESFSYFVELDNSTERLASVKDIDSWERKIRVYDAVRARSTTRFRVLVFTTKSADRLTHILVLARRLVSNSQRTLVCGTTLDTFLQTQQPLTDPVFLNHRGQALSLLPAQAGQRSETQPQLIGSAIADVKPD
jgi:hypothetical protein